MADSKIGGSSTSLMPASPFLRGLNTELSGVVDSTDFTKEELNMMIRADNTRSRRFGMDYEESYKFCNQYIDTSIKNLAFNCIEWTDYNAPDESQTYQSVPYIVVQIGGKIIFYKNSGLPFSNEQADYELDLRDYRIDTTDEVSYQTERCKFTAAYGCLFVTSKAIKPIRLRSAEDPEAPVQIIKDAYGICSCAVKDYKHGRGSTGYADGDWVFKILINGAVVKVLKTSEYGNEATFPCSWYIAREFNMLPSEVRYGITAVPQYNEPAFPPSQGAWTYRQDSITFKAPEDSGDELQGTLIGLQLKVHYLTSGHWREPDIENYSCQLSGGYKYTQETDLTLKIRDTSVGAQDYMNITDMLPKTSYAHLYNLLNQGWTVETLAEFYVARRAFPANNLAMQYLKDDKTSKFKPENLLNMTFGNTPAAKGHFILSYFDQDRTTVSNVETVMDNLVGAINEVFEDKSLSDRVTIDDIRATDITNPADADKEIPVVKPRASFVADMCAYAGRIFYLAGDTVLYSQVIAEDISKAGQCYSEADPTSEELSDVVETDGGHISLPEIGEGIKLAQLGTYLLIFGTRDNMFITGTANNLFTATAYTTGTLPVAPTQAPDSFVNTEFGLFYWGTTSVNIIGAAQDGLAPKDLTTDRMLNWFGRLTNTQHKWCKGVYSAAKKKVYWFYPSDEEKPRRLDLCLVYDIMKDAFTTHKITSEQVVEGADGVEDIKEDLPEIVSGLSMKNPYKSVKEYPVTAVANNIRRIGDYYVTTENFHPGNGPLCFIFDASKLSDLPIGETKDLIKLGDYTVEWVQRDSFGALHRYRGVKTKEGVVIDSSSGVVADNFRQAEGFYTKLGDTVGSYQLVHVFNSSVDSSVVYVTDLSWTGWEKNDTFTAPSILYGKAQVFAPFVAIDEVGGFGSTSYTSDTGLPAGGWRWLSDIGLSVVEVTDNSNYKILAEDPISSEEFSYESSTLLCFDVANGKVTFGDFRNNLLRDWTAGDFKGVGYHFDSYLISHPMNAVGYTKSLNPVRANSIVYNKNMPYLLSYFRRTEVGKTTDGEYLYPSKCQGSVLWDWRTSGEHGKWDSPQELYRPNKRTILSEGYVITKTNIRGIGRAFQVKLQSVEDNQMIVEALCFDVMNDGRI